MTDYSKYKYYKGEKENPFSNDTNPFDYYREKFWQIEAFDNGCNIANHTLAQTKERYYTILGYKLSYRIIEN
ncbi:MAG: hypothetical protein LBR10_05145 [Prevotellaceae bacterium]|jgi:hypothetical protein|nr:hypothetical protein [Prevotellaceae bacterium]